MAADIVVEVAGIAAAMVAAIKKKKKANLRIGEI